MTEILFVTNTPRQCGVYEFGKQQASALARSVRLRVTELEMLENTTESEYLDRIRAVTPEVIIYNWHPLTMRWVTGELLSRVRRIHPRVVQAAIAHDLVAPFPQLRAIIHPDPTFEDTPREFHIGRPVPDFTSPAHVAENVIGSFGFGFHHKGFPDVIEQVNAEFDSATVRLHMPYSHYGDPAGEQTRRLAQACIDLAKPGITVKVTHDYKTVPQLVEWLAGNTINCFFYEEMPGRGISSVPDYALAAGRPIALTDCCMFRHILKLCPAVRIKGSSLRQIIAAGTAPLEPFRLKWNMRNLTRDYEHIIDTITAPDRIDLISNRVLSTDDREKLRPVVAELQQRCPDIMSRKTPLAVWQNAYVFEQVKHTVCRTASTVVIGGLEDPSGAALINMGYGGVRITDPVIDGKGAREVWEGCLETGDRYDHVLCCSDFEHVDDDPSFIRYLYEMLKPGGAAFLTVVFQEGWKPREVKPVTDRRLYTMERLRFLAEQLPEGALQDRPTYFTFENTDYCFCSFAFQKKALCTPGEERIESMYIELLQAQFRELRRFDKVKNIFGPVTLKIAGKVYRGLKKFPMLMRALKKVVRLYSPNAAQSGARVTLAPPGGLTPSRRFPNTMELMPQTVATVGARQERSYDA